MQKRRTRSVHHHLLPILSRVPVTACPSPRQACSSSETRPSTMAVGHGLVAYIGLAEDVPRPMTRSAVSTARCTSLTAVLCYRSCGTLPLSILQATRLTCSSHRDSVLPAPRRPQTRSLYTCRTSWLCSLGGSTEPRLVGSGMQCGGVTRLLRVTVIADMGCCQNSWRGRGVIQHECAQ